MAWKDFDSEGDNPAELRINEIVADVLKRRHGGESVSDESIIADHPELMPALGRKLNQLQRINAARQAAALPEFDRPNGNQTVPGVAGETVAGIRIRCPHCDNQIQIVVDAPLNDIDCASCGSRFSLTGDKNDTAQSPAITLVGQFEFIERIGIGGFGTVWKARDIDLDRTVAVKIPRKGQLSDDEVEKFFREARAAAQLRHSNIVAVHEIGRSEDTIYIVSDLIRGLSLSDWRRTYPPSPGMAARLCFKIAQAVQHAHEKGVIHRDLKPQNIMIDADGEPHIMDFGLAKRDAGEITMTIDGQVLGTPAYMSPEQACGQSHDADARSDVYSMGVILFELLTAELPFRGNVRTLIHQILEDEPPSPRKLDSGVPKDLETICLKCLEKDPVRRYESARGLAEDLDRYVNDETVVAQPPSTLYKIRRWAYKNGRLVAAIVAMVAMLIVGVFVSQWFGNGAGSGLARTADTLLPVAQVTHMVNIDGRRSPGPLFKNGRVCEDDDLRIEVEFDALAYCFLFAVNPDGGIQLCYPEDEFEVQQKPVQQFGYPKKETQGFAFTDGPGQQAFIIVESPKRLPSFREWSSTAGNMAQAIAQTKGSWIWSDNSASLRSEQGTRGDARDLGGQGLEKLCRWIESANPEVTVHGISFPVEPR